MKKTELELKPAMIDFTGIPKPHYLVRANVSEDNMLLVGKALFPSIDETLADRDHVNTTHLHHAAWNAGHLLRKRFNEGEFLFSHTATYSFGIAHTDTEISIELEIVNVSETRKHGTFMTKFFNPDGKLLTILICEFIIKK
ncbi:hypothetical protein KAZ92_03650 [Candidatus Gracilibacteria bacterium]|nr:hypothetical protein [Candidatus Gracilibacteria bacterium]